MLGAGAAICLTVFFCFSAANAQSPALKDWPPGASKNMVDNRPMNVKEYLEGKYGKFDDDMSSDVIQTEYGPHGVLRVGGNIVMKNIINKGGEHGLARAVAEAFLTEEAELLGITDWSEIHEKSVKVGVGYGFNNTTDIEYQRYIGNLELRGYHINFSIVPDGRIVYMRAGLVPASPELYEAVKKKMLPKQRIEQLVKQDLKNDPPKELRPDWKFDPSKVKFEKYAIADPPYVIWKVYTAYIYHIDAFTGEILATPRLKKTRPITID